MVFFINLTFTDLPTLDHLQNKTCKVCYSIINNFELYFLRNSHIESNLYDDSSSWPVTFCMDTMMKIYNNAGITDFIRLFLPMALDGLDNG